MKILVIEDDEGLFVIERHVADIQDIQITTSKNLTHGIAQAKLTEFDVILTDLVLPDANGLEAITTLDKMFPVTPIIVMSSGTDSDTAINAVKIGAQDYIAKENITSKGLKRSITHSIERKKITRKLNETTAAVKVANQVKDRFLSIASHDLKVPITAIKGMSDLLIDEIEGSITAGQKHCLQRILGQCDSMNHLLNDLLEISALNSGKMELKPEFEPLVPFLQNIADTFLEIAKEKGINFNFEIISDLDEICFDKNRIYNVMSNLLSNAIKFCNSGDSVTLKTELVNDIVKISVADTGPGIKKDELPKLFKPFQKLSNTPTGSEKSTGLGLSIVDEIINLHGGRIFVNTEMNKGTCFSVLLSQKQNDTKTILIVEDEKDMSLVVKRKFKSFDNNFKILQAYDGIEAISILENNIIDLVITDSIMPRMGGLELLDIVKNQFCSIPVVVYTAQDYNRSGSEVIARGAAAYFNKPFDFNDIYRIVSRLLNVSNNTSNLN